MKFDFESVRRTQRVTAAVYSGNSIKQASLQIRVDGKVRTTHVLNFAGKKNPVKFCVGDPKAHSSVWSVFANATKSDVYVAIRSSASLHKMSLHESGDFRYQLIGTTKENLNRPDLSFNSLFEENGTGRILHQWKRQPSDEVGWISCMGISIPADDLQDGAGNFNDVVWIPRPSANHATEVRIFLVNPNKGQFDLSESLSPNGSLSVIGGFKLASGEILVIMSATVPVPAEEKNQLNRYRKESRRKAHPHFDWSPKNGPRMLAITSDAQGIPVFLDIKA